MYQLHYSTSILESGERNSSLRAGGRQSSPTCTKVVTSPKVRSPATDLYLSSQLLQRCLPSAGCPGWCTVLASPAVGREQGCGRKQQGSLEHLWALTELIEDCMEGRDGHAHAGVYALFAEVSKAYDQVWRSGLYSIPLLMADNGPNWGPFI